MKKEVFESIKPKEFKQKESDKYSYKLWKWLNDFYKNYRKEPQVFYLNSEGSGFSLDKIKENPKDVFFAIPAQPGSDDLIGIHLNSIIINGPRDVKTWYLIEGVAFDKSKLINITKEFFEEYEKIGRCLFINHGIPVISPENRFVYNDDKKERTCRWCHKKETLHEEEEIIIKKVWK